MPNDASAPTLSAVVGGNLRRLRDAHHLRQDDIALRVQEAGLTWGRSTVAMLEGGSKLIELGELLVLAGVLECEPEELLAGDGPVKLTDSVVGDLKVLRAVLAGRGHIRELVDLNPILDDRGRRAGVAAPMPYREAERKMARRLGVSVDDVVEASRELWQGRSLTEERDARVAAAASAVRQPGGTIAAGRALYRSRQALRGHVTRALTAELALRLEKGDRDGQH
ncbi:MAG TPA: helix-turn-helix transcriptional regulator [Acidimicrobiales bacterium]|nr:helix-turn-helix transcriptional regulator [Acidimicrobiales bacterium]